MGLSSLSFKEVIKRSENFDPISIIGPWILGQNISFLLLTLVRARDSRACGYRKESRKSTKKTKVKH